MSAVLATMGDWSACEPWRAAPRANAAAPAPPAPLAFTLPPELEAREPAEARGLARDEVRLMVTFDDDSVTHTRFTRFPHFVNPGDVLVVNTSATINAALPATRPDGEPVELHLSQRLPGGQWVVELRRLAERGTEPLLTANVGERLALPAGGTAALLAPYRPGGRARGGSAAGTRLWLASLAVPGDVARYLDVHGYPIRYGYVPRAWPLPYYQTIFAREPGSAEMPSAGRAFTPRVLAALRAKGVVIAPILLHTGVASVEAHEPPYPEQFRVSARTASAVNEARRDGRRVIAVGTTAVRALESVASEDGTVRAGQGWTDLVVTPERGVYAVDALLTGFHEPRASHLAMLEAIAGRRHLEVAYEAALGWRYLWHEFGDLHLLLGGERQHRSERALRAG
jgi:S-adenosylmethionine:tRNA ribosyltransferase-isomerase